MHLEDQIALCFAKMASLDKQIHTAAQALAALTTERQDAETNYHKLQVDLIIRDKAVRSN